MTKNTSRKKIKRKPKRRINKRNLWTLILAVLAFFELIGVAAGFVIFGKMLQDKPVLSVDDFFSQESSHIYDKDGNQIADVGMQLRENVSYNELSESIIDCFLAAEDSRYFEHDGFDMPRFIKAVMVSAKNVLTRSPARQGGSTFTMQLVKVTYFQNDETGAAKKKDIEYKVEQIALARELETKSNKKMIFEMYLNKLNFGGTGNIRGVEKAAEYYYGKHASELNLAEAAMLAGVINSPYRYDPHNFLEAATFRRNIVLNLLKQHGYITAEECKLAKAIKVEDTLIDPRDQRAGGYTYAYQSYIDTVITEAETLTGQDPYNVAMDIYTFMDPAVQQVMDDIQSEKNESVQFPDELMEVGMISENNQTGEIVAIGGGRNYGRGGSMLLNHATAQYKQPGSSVKPFLDYALAFEYLGWATSHTVTDKPIAYAGTNTVIKNANGEYYGQVSLNYAVGVSLNTPAIQALQEVIETAGWQTVVNYITNLGFSKISGDNFDIGFAIGGSNFICSAKELMAAQAIIMNGGNYIQPHTISKIVFRSGTQEPVSPTYEARNVLTPQAAYLTSLLMYDAVYTQYWNYMQLLQRPNYAVYGKTGTTDWGSEGLQYNIPQGAAKDKWMVSETSQYTTVVWVGYEKGVKDKETYFTRAKSDLNLPGNISNAILSALTDQNPPADLVRPDGISEISHIVGTFPYAKPIEGMDPALLRNGMIKSDKANLVDAETQAIDPLNSFNATLRSDGGIDLSWSPYPDQSRMQMADSTMDISLYNSNGEALVWATGQRLFDYSWLFGPLKYKAKIRQYGLDKTTVTSDTENSTQHVDLDPDTDTEVCGYYAYENEAQRSNEVCVTFKTPKKEDPDFTIAPNSNDNAAVAEWCGANGIAIAQIADNAKADTHEFILKNADGSENVMPAGSVIKESQKGSLICRIYVHE